MADWRAGARALPQPLCRQQCSEGTPLESGEQPGRVGGLPAWWWPQAAASQAVSYPNAPQPQQQPPQQMQMGAVPVCQGAVVVQPSGYPQAVAQPYGGAVGYGQQPQAVPMGQVIS